MGPLATRALVAILSKAVEVRRLSPGSHKDQRLGSTAEPLPAIADLWWLTEEERRLVLGLPSRSTFHHWAKTVREHGEITLDVDVPLRISAVLGIHQALQILYPDEREGVAWLRRPHRALVFGGKPPLALVISGTQDGVLTVRRFLDAARGGL